MYRDHDVLMCVKAKLFNETRDRKGLLEVFKRLSQVDDLLSKTILSRDDVNCNIGRVFSPHDVTLMKVVNLWKKEGNILLLLRYSVLRITTRTNPQTRLSWGRYTVLGIIVD